MNYCNCPNCRTDNCPNADDWRDPKDAPRDGTIERIGDVLLLWTPILLCGVSTLALHEFRGSGSNAGVIFFFAVNLIGLGMLLIREFTGRKN